jgi:hypothetical protein
MKGLQTGKEEVTSSIFADDVICNRPYRSKQTLKTPPENPQIFLSPSAKQ